MLNQQIIAGTQILQPNHNSIESGGSGYLTDSTFGGHTAGIFQSEILSIETTSFKQNVCAFVTNSSPTCWGGSWPSETVSTLLQTNYLEIHVYLHLEHKE